jgi:outer membrane protein TolC
LQRVRDLSEESYAAGVIGLTDVLDADRQLLAAKDDLAVARESAACAAIGSYLARLKSAYLEHCRQYALKGV